jgi:hypothetical protein
VEVKKHSPDGGVDIVVAGGTDQSALPVMVQCKSWSPGRKVEVDVVRSLAGSVLAQGVTKGMIVTTSYFTPSAAPAARQITTFSRDRLQLDLVDFNNVTKWLTNTPKLTPTFTLSAESVYRRHAEPVDLSFARGLSHSETAELQEIEQTLDILESPRA